MATVTTDTELLEGFDPEWCTAGCGTEAHYGEDEKVGLSLEEPWHGENLLTGRMAWEPAEVTLCLGQERGAVHPYVSMELPRSVAYLTLAEVGELVDALRRLREQGYKSVLAERDRRHAQQAEAVEEGGAQ